MINTLKGTVVEIQEQTITIENASGIGFAVQVASPHAFTQGKETSVRCYLHWNQEQGPSLFGFLSEEEKELFLLVISCSGIGPKMGLSILAQMRPDSFVGAVQEGNVKVLSSLHGIGAKKAEQIIVQLKHKVTKLAERVMVKNGSSVGQHFNTIADVLTSLNYSKQEVSAVFDYLRQHYAAQEVSFDELLRKSLSYLAKRVS